MPRRAEERPIRASDPEVALQAAMRQALERGAAPGVPIRAPDAEAPAFGGRIAEAAAVRPATAVPRHRSVRSQALARPRKAERPDSIADPHGRGGKVDLRG